MAEIQDIAITWWDSPPDVCVIQDRKKNFLSCPMRVVLFDALACAEDDGRVAGVVMTGGSTEESKRFEERIRRDYKDVLEEAVSAVKISPTLRGPFGVAKIELKDGAKAIRRKFFRCSGERKTAMEVFIDKLIAKGWIVPSHSEWAAQAF